ncbi:MAG: alpha/beta fold hydrolase [Candidatus Lokiarchaeota archaeon]|nr:alpha/beta fold hydrolase [Candidatus Lokiarchaeota archaeon]
MEHKESSFQGVNELKIFYQKWIPDQPKAVIQLVHGIGEHSSRYGNVVDKLLPLGYAIYADDHRGHGRSEGQRNHIDNFEQYVDDEKMLFDIIKAEHHNLPVFMLGHSMGALIAIYFTKEYEDLLQGIVLSGIGNDIGGDISGFLRFMAKVLSAIAPKLAVAQGDLSKFLSHDENVVEEYRNDPNVYTEKTSARLGKELLTRYSKYQEFVQDFKIPLLIQAGGEDKLVLGAKESADYFKMEDKTVKIYNGLFHEVYNELKEDRDKVLEDLKNWLENHI